MSPIDAIVAATGNAARALGWEARLGTLETGKVADMIVVDSNPLDDLRILADKDHLHLVMKGGQVAACHAGNDVPPPLWAKQVLLVK